ncbi:MAG: heparan-alpha-glucosaminide N-acetyltransferase domain-containing protein [Myxococcota bacterium]
MTTPRVEGVDVARGIASLVMIQGHAYHGWVAPEHHATTSYQLTRLLGTLPLPAFLVLAGAAIAHRVEAAARRDEDAAVVRRAVIRRGLVVVLWGYLTNGLFALIDGGRTLDTLLRADVLHVIGLSIVLLAWLGIRGEGTAAPSLRRLGWTALGLGATVTAASPWLNALTPAASGYARFVVALVADVPGVTRMPVVPLTAWMCAGAGVGLLLIARRKARPADAFAARAGAPGWTLAGIAAAALAGALVTAGLTDAAVAASGEPLSRAHPAVGLNVLDLAARGALVLAVGAVLTPWLPHRARHLLVRLGRGSLLAYVVHIPFCYGRLGGALRGNLDMASATVWVIMLMVMSYVVVFVRDETRARARAMITNRQARVARGNA